LAVDHYFDPSADPVEEFSRIRSHIDKLFGESTELCLSEWGAIHGETPARARAVLQAALDSGIDCFNYWHAGPGGIGEALLQHDPATSAWQPADLYDVLRDFYGGNP